MKGREFRIRTAFIDRNREMADLRNYLKGEPNSILFLYGPKSSGKTTVSIGLATFPVDGGRVNLPSGMIKGQKIHRLFYELCWPVLEIDDFSEFPRDFSCVATDIVTGDPYVIDSGSLTDAMRASMAIPTAFSPYNMDGRLLVDGGLVRNLPAVDAIELGADIVICIDVSSELVGADSLRSLLDITDQTMDILMKSTMDAQKKYCDLYIRPDLVSVGTLDFGDVPYIIEQGEKAARRHIEEIRSLVEKTGGFRDPPEQMEETPVSPVLITRVRLDGLSEVPSKFVSSLLGIKPPDSITADDMDKALQKLYSTGYFSRISYRSPSTCPVVKKPRPSGRSTVAPSASVRVANGSSGETLSSIVSSRVPIDCSLRRERAMKLKTQN